MRNRAKCKLCESIIESFHSTDYVVCKCGAIAVDGGDALYCFANDFSNFVRVDENGNEILVKIENDKILSRFDIANMQSESGSQYTGIKEITLSKKQELLKELDELINGIESLPRHAMDSPITHADFCSLLMLLSAILRC